jgi:hypothetical protein
MLAGGLLGGSKQHPCAVSSWLATCSGSPRLQAPPLRRTLLTRHLGKLLYSWMSASSPQAPNTSRSSSTVTHSGAQAKKTLASIIGTSSPPASQGNMSQPPGAAAAVVVSAAAALSDGGGGCAPAGCSHGAYACDGALVGVPGVPGHGIGSAGDATCGAAAPVAGRQPSAALAAIAVSRMAAWSDSTAGLLQPAACCSPELAGRGTCLGVVQQAAASWLLEAKDIGRQTTMTTVAWHHGHTSKVPASCAVWRGPAGGAAAAAAVRPGRSAGCQGPPKHAHWLRKHAHGAAESEKRVR